MKLKKLFLLISLKQFEKLIYNKSKIIFYLDRSDISIYNFNPNPNLKKPISTGKR